MAVNNLKIGYIALKKLNGVTVIVETNPNALYQSGVHNPHLCGKDCENARADMCDKVHDVKKELITEYEFIKSGYQTFDSKGDVDDFIVLDCDNYKKEKRLCYETR